MKLIFVFNLLIGLFLIASPLPLNCKSDNLGLISSKYHEIKGNDQLDIHLFERAYLGYIDLKLSGVIEPQNHIFTIIDFSLAASSKRLWVIDLKNNEVLFHTFVAHGENSGKEYAQYFSNELNTHKSSLGYYLTQETYRGKNGISLRLKGLEYGINHNTRKRYIVLHGADYVSTKYLKENGTIGQSKGCPAVPIDLHEQIIASTKQGSCLFIYYPEADYLRNSAYFFDN